MAGYTLGEWMLYWTESGPTGSPTLRETITRSVDGAVVTTTSVATAVGVQSVQRSWDVWADADYPVRVTNYSNAWEYGVGGVSVWDLLSQSAADIGRIADSVRAPDSSVGPPPLTPSDTNDVGNVPDSWTPYLNASPIDVDTDGPQLDLHMNAGSPRLYLWDEQSFVEDGSMSLPAGVIDFSDGEVGHAVRIFGKVAGIAWRAALAVALLWLARREIRYYASLAHTDGGE